MALIVDIKVTPSAGRHEWQLNAAGQLKCFVKSPPEKGRANAEVIKMLAKALKIAQNEIEIMSGQTSRKKRIKIHTSLTFEELLDKLGLERQLPLTS